MTSLVTGSAGHLGEALVRSLAAAGQAVAGLDIKPSSHTEYVGSLTDASFVNSVMRGVKVVYHTATLHKPHVVTHSEQDFVDTNVTGTLNVLQAAVAQGVDAVVFTSTTSTYGAAMRPAAHEPAVWIDETVTPVPKNIYGVTKLAAEELCGLYHRRDDLPVVVLRTSRFFAEEDDDPKRRDAYSDANIKLNEFLFRRVDIEDVVSAHRLAAAQASSIGFQRFVISATTPFVRDDLQDLHRDAPPVLSRHVPHWSGHYERLGWRMFPVIERVYDNAAARRVLGWQPQHDFATVLERLSNGGELGSNLALRVGSKGYHEQTFRDGPYPV